MPREPNRLVHSSDDILDWKIELWSREFRHFVSSKFEEKKIIFITFEGYFYISFGCHIDILRSLSNVSILARSTSKLTQQLFKSLCYF